MRKLYVAVLLLIAHCSLSQQEFFVINGNIAFKSAKPANVDIMLNVSVNGNVLKQLQLDKTLIFRDSIEKRNGDTIWLNAIVASPTGYQCISCPYKYQVSGFQSLYIKRKQDVYADFLQQANRSMNTKQYDKALQIYSDALGTEAFESNSQRYELDMGLTRVYYRQKDYLKQADALSAMSDEDGYLDNLDAGRLRVYWQERFNNILNLARYDTLKGIPLCNAVKLIESDTLLSKVWTQFFQDYKEYKKVDLVLWSDGERKGIFDQVAFVMKDMDITDRIQLPKCSE
ncbi:MAG: hypothetical protein ABW019_09980 [Chitinophagaceae bacterium]